MANISRECTICDYAYDMGHKKHRILGCGHTFCSGCLTQMKNANNENCAICRYDWSTQEIEELPVVYQLVDDAAGGVGIRADACDEHSLRMAFWCRSCDKAACNVCLSVSHHQCDWVLLEPTLNEGRDTLDNTRDEILEKIGNKSDMVTEAVTKNNDQRNTLRMFKMAVKDLESNMTVHEDILRTLQTDLTDTWEMVENITPENFGYHGLEPLKRANHKAAEGIPIGSGATLYDIARTYQELGDDVSGDNFLTNFCLFSQALVAEQNWIVEDKFSSTGALIALTNSATRPSKLILEFDQDVSELRVSCLLTVAALECPRVVLRFLKEFWEPSETSIEKTTKRLDKLLIDDTRTYLQEFVGSLDVACLLKLPAAHLVRLGLAVTASQDMPLTVNVLTAIMEHGVLRELHLSVAAEVNADDLCELSPDLHEGFPLHLHFPKLADDGLQRMVLIIKKLMTRHNNSQRIRKVYMPKSSLTARGVELLLGVVHGANITMALYVEAPDVSAPQRAALSEKAVGLRLKLSLNDLDLRSIQDYPMSEVD